MKTKVSLLVVDDDPQFRQVLAGELQRVGYAVSMAGSGTEAIRVAAESGPQVVLLDLRLPDMDGLDVLRGLRQNDPLVEVILLTGHGSIDTAIQSVRMGAFDYVSKPCPLDELEIRIQRAVETRALRQRADILAQGLSPPDVGSSFIGESPAFRQLIAQIDRVAPSLSTVFICGETGSGKEMVAKLIHARSPRRGGPFVVVECAALQEGLLQSELFGHERGAFTGADRTKPGLFEVANGGTIFLDEIGEVSQATQVKLLRVLDTSTFRHVGGTTEKHVDVRVLAATNRDLPEMVRQGLFREDLYYRMSTFTVAVPPLRERRADIDLLVEHFVAVLNDRFGFSRRIGPGTLDVLRRYDWPGNIRELLHVVEASVVVSEEEILPEHVPANVRTYASGPTRAAESSELPTLEDLERAHIERVLNSTGGHRGNAARILGISERNLYRKLREYGLF